MPSNEPESPDDSFFNDLSQQPQQSNTTNNQESTQAASSKAKRIACVLCRKRKLRCDGARPACSTCERLSHDCTYDQVRKKSGPKRGYVKLLEQRLQQVETLLKTQDTADTSEDATRRNSASEYIANTSNVALPNTSNTPNVGAAGHVAEQHVSQDMIGLGLEEPLPPQEVMDDLYQIYFSKIHLSIPIVHRPRFFAALNLAPHMRPPVCLRYIMWTIAASVSDKYDSLQEHFYQRARKYAQLDEMKGHGESTITLAHCQTWILICTYEFKTMYFPRAWISAGRAVRLAQMMQLHRMDGFGLDVKQCLPPPKDWTEREERRRTFWMAFCVDRYASIGTGWPMSIDERDIMTNLPSSEEAFEKSKPMSTGSLEQVLQPNGAANLQPLGGIVLTATMFGRNLLHLHRPGPNDKDDDINGGYWSRHRDIEKMLLQASLGLPDHMRLPAGVADPNVVFTNMCIHTSSICLHQAAIFKVDKHRLPANISNESKIRCVTAAAEIANLMRMISHMDLSAMNPFISFCVYVAARVFVQYLKTRPNDQQMTASLEFLLQAMQAIRRKNRLTESFLVQIDLDLHSAGLEGIQRGAFARYTTKPTDIPDDPETWRCGPIMTMGEQQDSAESSDAIGDDNRTTQYMIKGPGPPFHVCDIDSLNLQIQNERSRTSQVPLQGSHTTTGPRKFPPGGVVIHDGIEMDICGGNKSVDYGSPATISSQSRGGSTSQSSYSPSQRNELHIPYRASPKTPYATLAAGGATILPNSVSFSTVDFDSSGSMGNAGLNDNLAMSNEWDYAALNAEPGLPVMNDASWDAMLESVTLGWDSGSQMHDSVTDMFGAR